MPRHAIDKQRAFLAAFVECASLTKAAASTGIDRGTHYKWLNADPEYVAEYQAARDQAGQTLEDDAIEWARKGVFEPIVYQGAISRDDAGEPIGTWRRSETMMLRLLKAFLPARYAERGALELSGPQGGPISLHADKLKKLTDEELAQLLAMSRKLAADSGDGSGDPPPIEE